MDSLTALTLELQQKISSPEIHRLSEYLDEILLDLDSMDLRDDISIQGDEVALSSADLIKQYLALNQDLAHCFEACNQFHEEAFMLETTILEIKGKAGLRGENQDALRKMLDGEWSIYKDLANRIDSGIKNVNHHSRLFYSLKPSIDSILYLD